MPDDSAEVGRVGEGGAGRVMALEPEDYDGIIAAETGTPLVDIFPDGIYVAFHGDEVVGISPDPTAKMRELGLLKTE